jgi:hypothetical protein
MNQETLEEVAKLAFSYEYGGEETSITDRKRDAFIEGAEWQSERMYSEEEVLSMLRSFDSNFNQDELKESILKKWFEQFKKK